MVAMVLLGSKVVVDAWDMRIKTFTLEFVQVVTRKKFKKSHSRHRTIFPQFMSQYFVLVQVNWIVKFAASGLTDTLQDTNLH